MHHSIIFCAVAYNLGILGLFGEIKVLVESVGHAIYDNNACACKHAYILLGMHTIFLNSLPHIFGILGLFEDKVYP